MKAQVREVDVDETTVADIMTSDVRTVTPETGVGDLIRLLSSAQITGVPVVTDGGRLRGVVSATDVLRAAADEPFESIDENVWGEPWEDEDLAADVDENPRAFYTDVGVRAVRFGAIAPPAGRLDDVSVADIMTPATFTVRRNATIRELARFLARGRIHRALVVDDGRVAGIVTAFDVVRALAGPI